jgi:hypothetical protein
MYKRERRQVTLLLHDGDGSRSLVEKMLVTIVTMWWLRGMKKRDLKGSDRSTGHGS